MGAYDVCPWCRHMGGHARSCPLRDPERAQARIVPLGDTIGGIGGSPELDDALGMNACTSQAELDRAVAAIMEGACPEGHGPLERRPLTAIGQVCSMERHTECGWCPTCRAGYSAARHRHDDDLCGGTDFCLWEEGAMVYDKWDPAVVAQPVAAPLYADGGLCGPVSEQHGTLPNQAEGIRLTGWPQRPAPAPE